MTRELLFPGMLSVMLTFASCHHRTGSTGDMPSSAIPENETLITRDQFTAAGMVLADMDTFLFEDVIRVNGTIEVAPEGKALISTLIPGVVRRILVTEGQPVNKGQILFTLENTAYIDLQQEYLQTYHRLQYSQSEYNRQKELINGNITSQKSLVAAESDYFSTLAAFEALKTKLELVNLDPASVEQGNIVPEISVVAPLGGFVTLHDIYLGTYVESQQTVMEIIDLRQLQLKLSVFEKDLLRIEKGQPVRYRGTQSLGAWHPGTVMTAGRSVDAESKSAVVYGKIGERDYRDLVNGMYIEAEIIARGRQAYGLPNEAVQQDGEKSFVFVRKDETDGNIRLKRVYVETGQAGEEYTEIMSDTIIRDILVKGAFNLVTE